MDITDIRARFEALSQYWSTKKVRLDFGVHQEPGEDPIAALGFIRVPDELKGQGLGTQAMKAVVDLVDTLGIGIILIPTAMFGSDWDRLVEFYRKFGFTGNKHRMKYCAKKLV